MKSIFGISEFRRFAVAWLMLWASLAVSTVWAMPQEPPAFHELPTRSETDGRVAHADFHAPVEFDQSVEDDALEAILNEDEGSAGILNGLKQQAGQLDITRMLGSLAIVLGGYFVFVWLMRRFQGSAARGLPREVVQVMGTMPFGQKQRLHVVRLGSKLLLIVNGPDGTQSIGEIDDRHEVEYLADLCRGKKPRHRPERNRTGDSASLQINVSDQLRQVIRQLQNTVDGQKPESVFEA